VEYESVTCTYDHADTPVGQHHDRPRDGRSGTRTGMMDDGGKDANNGSILQRMRTAQHVTGSSQVVMTYTACIIPMFQVQKQTWISFSSAERALTIQKLSTSPEHVLGSYHRGWSDPLGSEDAGRMQPARPRAGCRQIDLRITNEHARKDTHPRNSLSSESNGMSQFC